MPELQQVSIQALQESKTNPRKDFHGLEELTASVKARGILEPLVVRPLGGSNGERHYEIVAGARRFRAAKSAKLSVVPVNIMELTDVEALEVQLIENLLREDVHPLDEALGYEQLIKNGIEANALAERVNKSEAYIRQRLQLSKLIPEAQKAFRAEKFTVSHAIILARIPSEKTQKEFLKYALEGGSARQLAEATYRQNLLLKDAPWDLADETLVLKAGSCVACPKRTGANPMLFPDIKEKDVCTDSDCFVEKMTAQVARNTEKGLISIATHYQSYGETKVPGVLFGGDYTLVQGKKDDCKSSQAAMIVAKNSWDKTVIGSEVKICADKKCTVHHARQSTGGSEVSGMTPAQKAKMRRDRAISAARTEAVGRIGGAIEWPLSIERARIICQATFSLLSREGRKLACKAVGLWPEDGKISKYDFDSHAQKYIKESKPDVVAGFLMVCSVVPDWGKWYASADETARINAAAKGTTVNLAALERAFIKEADEKAKEKAKRKSKNKK